MCIIRKANPNDLSALYRISLATGDIGNDAAHLYADPQMIGHIYSAPYLTLSPELAFVVERNGQVLGFVVGTNNTIEFEDLLEEKWWPSLREIYPKSSKRTRSTWTADERRRFMIHVPGRAPEEIAKDFPGHLHVNLLPEIQGRGFGRRLVDAWLAQTKLLGVSAVHVGTNEHNVPAISFWRAMGFETLDATKSRTVWMGRKLD